MTLEDIIHQVANEMELPYDVCYKAYMASWKFILTKVQALPVNEDMTLEEFKKLRVNFNMPSLGKLNITEDAFLRRNKRIKIIKEFREKKHVQSKED